MQEMSIIQQIAIFALPVLFAITVHEVAHGWMAKKLGDSTAMMLGRLTLNPLKHIDPVGTIIVPLVMSVTGGFLFGWAKPVPVNWSNLKNPKRDMALVAIAGPAVNLLMALIWALIIKIGFLLGVSFSWLATPLIAMGQAGILINILLMVLNLIPLPPLDGGRVMTGLLPEPLARKYSRIEPYGFKIFLGLFLLGYVGVNYWPPLGAVMMGLLDTILWSPVNAITAIIYQLFQL